MKEEQAVTRIDRAERESYVVLQDGDNFRVYAPKEPRQSALVAGFPEAPTCTCPEFAEVGDPHHRCPHIEAIMRTFGSGNGSRRATPARPSPTGDSPRMLLKRSVSPDGKIDALSVELSLAIDGLTGAEIKKHAGTVLRLQSAVADLFLGRRVKRDSEPRPTSPSNGTMLASILGVEQKQTTYGPRLCLIFEVDRREIWLFGSRKRLGEALTQAGFPERVRDLRDGLQLDLPCRVTLTDNGRYQRIAEVFPAEEAH